MIERKIEQWLQAPFDKATQDAVRELHKDKTLLEDAFYKDLSFGTGGMRGIMGVGTNRINAYTLGKSTQGLCYYLKKKYPNEPISAVVAHDCRNNSKTLAKTVADVFTANHIQCYLFSDLRPTPELSFAVRHLKANCGIVLTASHNPPKYNGYKVYSKDGGQLVPPEEGQIIDHINSTRFEDIRFEGQKKLLTYIDREVDAAYHQSVLESANFSTKQNKKFHLVFTPLHGTAIMALPKVLLKANYQHVSLVETQAKPDGNFPTVESPNPEEPEALAEALEMAKKNNADMVIGTDPDADRFGVAVPDHDGNWQLLNGNQTMAVLTEFLLQKHKKENTLHDKQFIASTIVSSPLIEKIAAYYGIQYKSCLTGFKWIAALINEHPELKFIGGGEESFGYLVGTQVRDKDAISASLLACEIGLAAKEEGKSFWQLLLACYQKYGFYYERLFSLTKEGKSGAQAIAKMMAFYRNNPPNKIAGIDLVSIEDYLRKEKLEIKTRSKETLSLPKADVLIFNLEDQSRIALRPSGTEPKIKFYFSVNTPYLENVSFEQQKIALHKKTESLMKSFNDYDA